MVEQLHLGHPLGATGVRITAKAAQILKRENKKYALATQCIGLGSRHSNNFRKLLIMFNKALKNQ